MDDYKRIQESFGLLDMIREVLLKAALLKQRVTNQDPALREEDVEGNMQQMRKDLAKYSERLEEIYKELLEYGYVSTIPGMDGTSNTN